MGNFVAFLLIIAIFIVNYIVYKGFVKIIQLIIIKKHQMERQTNEQSGDNLSVTDANKSETITPPPAFTAIDTTELPIIEKDVPVISEPETRPEDAINIYPSKVFKITTNGVNFMNGNVIGIIGVSVFRAEPLIYVFQSDELGTHNLTCRTMADADQFYNELLAYEKGEYSLDAFSEIANKANDIRPQVEKLVESFELIIPEIPVIKNPAYYGNRKLTKWEFSSHAEKHFIGMEITKISTEKGFYVVVKDKEGNEARLPKDEDEYLPVSGE